MAKPLKLIAPELVEELKQMYAVAKTVRGAVPEGDPRRVASVKFTAALQSLVEEGFTPYAIGKQLNISHAGITARLARHGYREPTPSMAGITYTGKSIHTPSECAAGACEACNNMHRGRLAKGTS